MNITYVTPKDYEDIKKCFTDDEIRETYGILKIMTQKDYAEMQNIKSKKGDGYYEDISKKEKLRR